MRVHDFLEGHFGIPFSLMTMQTCVFAQILSCDRLLYLSLHGHPSHYILPSIRTYLPSTLKLWNGLPDQLIGIDDLNDFKGYLEYYLPLTLITPLV